MAKLPPLLAASLDAETAWRAVDRPKHPHISQRLFVVYISARDALRQEYPKLTVWLFDYPYHQEHREELLRLLAEAQKEAANEHH